MKFHKPLGFLVTSLLLLGFSANAEDFESIVPKMNLEFWNDGGFQYDNNCYNYSTNQRTDTFAQPGEASGKMTYNMACEAVHAAAEQDLGLTPANYLSFVDKYNSESLIALVVAPDYDYHWYRRDDSQLWSHKPGGTPATNRDDAGEIIVDPEVADRGPYSDFCGYFIVKSYKLHEHEQDSGYVRVGNMEELPDLNANVNEPGTDEPSTNDPNDPKTNNDDNYNKTWNQEQIGSKIPGSSSESVLSTLKYSGLPNPKTSLKTVLNTLKSPQLRSVQVSLLQMAQSLQAAPLVTVRKPLVAGGLGYKGILIQDKEGLVFPKGTVVRIQGNAMAVEFLNGSQKVVKNLPQASVFEKFVLSQF